MMEWRQIEKLNFVDRTISNMADRINLTKTIVERANTLFKMVHDGRNLKVRIMQWIIIQALMNYLYTFG